MTSILDARTGNERRQDNEPDFDRAKVSLKTALGLVVIVAGMLSAYYVGLQAAEGRTSAKVAEVERKVGDNTSRLSVLEAQREEDRKWRERIENKVDRLLERR